MKAQLTAAALADKAEDVAVSLLGKPTLVTNKEFRWGSHGSLSLRRSGKHRGDYYDHERREGGDLLDLIARERGVPISEAIAIAERDYLGGDLVSFRNATSRRREVLSRNNEDEDARTRTALRIFEQSATELGPIAERYFTEHRHLNIRNLRILSHVLRWNSRIGAIVALMTDPITGKQTGIHRTFLDQDGAKIERKMLGKKGCIRLSPDEEVTTGLGIVEGIEDGLAVLLSGWAPVWCAADAGSLARFPVLAGIECLSVFADADVAGLDAAEHCAARWVNAGLEARILPPVPGGK